MKKTITILLFLLSLSAVSAQTTRRASELSNISPTDTMHIYTVINGQWREFRVGQLDTLIAALRQLTGDVTTSGFGSVVATIANGVVGPDELAATAVTPGSYTNADVTVDADGRITAASNGTDADGIKDATTGLPGGNVTINAAGNNLDISNYGLIDITHTKTGLRLNESTGSAYLYGDNQQAFLSIESSGGLLFQTPTVGGAFGINGDYRLPSDGTEPDANDIMTWPSRFFPAFVAPAELVITNPFGGTNTLGAFADSTFVNIGGAGGGESNTASNLATPGLFVAKNGVDLEFRGIAGGGGNGITTNATTLTVTHSINSVANNDGISGSSEIMYNLAGVNRKTEVDTMLVNAGVKKMVADPALTDSTNININLEGAVVGVYQIDMTNAATSTTINFNAPTNPVNGGVYTFHFQNVASNNVDFPATFLDQTGTAWDASTTVTYATDEFFTCYFDSTNYYCK